MDNPELRLHCLELAISQARMEGKHQDRNEVAQISTEFYAWVIGTDEPELTEETPEAPKRRGRKPKTGKSSNPFE